MQLELCFIPLHNTNSIRINLPVMNKVLVAALTMVTLFTTQASAQVATFNSLSLPFSNTILTTAQYNKVLESSNYSNVIIDDNSLATKQHLAILPTTGYMFGDNSTAITPAILLQPTDAIEPMAIALEKWMEQEITLQQPKRRHKR